MDFSKQAPKAAKAMKEGFEKKMTCIECHQGIAHKLPKDPDDDEPAEDNKDAAADPKAGDKPADPKVEPAKK